MARKKPAPIVDLSEVYEDEETLEEKVFNLRKQIADLTELNKTLSAQLLEDFITTRKRRGDKFKLAVRKTLRITDPTLAFIWAAERSCIDVNTSKALKVIRRQLTVPNGFAVQETSFLSMMRDSHDDTDDAEDGG